MTTYKKKLSADKPKVATRKSSEMALEVINGAAAGNHRRLRRSDRLQQHQDQPDQDTITPDDYGQRYVHYGIREHGMAAAMNGLALHGGLIAYGGTFLVLLRLLPARRSGSRGADGHPRRSIVMTHDSIGLGEDGPTHQPVEHLAALRAIPNLQRLPAGRHDRDRRMLADRARSRRRRRLILALTRQNLPTVRAERSATAT